VNTLAAVLRFVGADEIVVACGSIMFRFLDFALSLYCEQRFLRDDVEFMGDVEFMVTTVLVLLCDFKKGRAIYLGEHV
jgi:hypothetical protein